MTTMIETTACPECAGTQKVPHPRAGETYTCTWCDGCGVRKVRGHGGYKTAAGARKALANRTGIKCRDCDGVGTRVYPADGHCYSCHDGVVVTSALPGAAWPADVPRGVRYAMGRDEVMADYAAAVNVHVQAQNRAGTWNEAYLGLGSIVSVTDYGRRWDALVDAVKSDTLESALDTLRDEVRKGLNGTQYVKLTRADDTLATDIAVTVHRNGYTVQAVDARPENVVLPPTYSDEVLSRPMV